MIENETIVSEIQKGNDRSRNLELLYNQNRGLIYNVVRCYVGQCEIEDLMQEAYIAMCQTVERYNPKEGTFVAYFCPCLKRYIRRYLIENCSMIRIPEWRQEQIRKYNAICCQYAALYGRKPSEAEIGRCLGINAEQVGELLKAVEMGQITSLDTPTGEEGGTFADILEDPAGSDAMETIINEQIYNELWQCVNDLEPEQAAVIHCIYRDGMNCKAAGERLSMDVKTVNKTRHKALLELRHRNVDYREKYGSQLYAKGSEWMSTPERIAVYG